MGGPAGGGAGVIVIKPDRCNRQNKKNKTFHLRIAQQPNATRESNFAEDGASDSRQV